MDARRRSVGRVIFVTSVGSCLLVIFYFQMVHKGPGIGEYWSRKGDHRGSGANSFSQEEFESMLAIHERRRVALQRACEATDGSSSSSASSPGVAAYDADDPGDPDAAETPPLSPESLRHLLVDDEHRLLYCYVPKVACTNWKRVLLVLTGQSGGTRDPLGIPAARAHVQGTLRSLAEFPPREARRRLASYVKFMFSREPFERLVSAYRNKFTQAYNTAFHRRYGTRIVRRYRANATAEALEGGDDVSFGEFVRYLLDPRTEPFNEHWELASSLCSPCRVRYDVIGRYETLERDAAFVLRSAGADRLVGFPAFPKQTRTTNEMTAKFFENITAEDQVRLYELYRLDFLLFNYSVPGYLRTQ
ncbi:carbohydrate sulfotransferase 11 [Lethenteron reissneri]|uniref:carbohydrate sulfotransferase 11 n=1 Tax=Lethenteron reissneri TaxID=7753 RepID=UPI002AB74A84|nr:carbohydrate sulfotransferase 11 [Lethenteron reissneri]